MDPKVARHLMELLIAVGSAYLLILAWRGILKRRLKGRDKYVEGSQAVRLGILLAIWGFVGVATFIGLVWAEMTGHVR
jgi:hypothetical protein